ncbi:MAG TPA: argininosuccinate lyase [Candidatus Cybelea sp.]|nr:argininosuccinate lyase [Candidatus Cybelea sp.]
MSALQWGGRFGAAPDAQLLAFGSSIEEDLVLAPFDVECSLGHVEALRGGKIVSETEAAELASALAAVGVEIRDGSFANYARAQPFEDVHGAIDARVREIAGVAGESLHAGRSRNDQVATTLLLYAADRALAGAKRAHAIAAALVARAREELARESVVAGCTHRQPAQPVLLGFLLVGWSEPFVRSVWRFATVARAARASCPLGSSALAGSSLALDRGAAARALGFTRPSRNALDAIGNRDVALDLAHAFVRALIDASRIAEELIAWSAPGYGYVALGDAASTGSSLMPQKRNPDPFELVRAHAARSVGAYAGALGTLCGLAPSYQRDLQETKSLTIAIAEDGLATLNAFERAWSAVSFQRERMARAAVAGYTVATDVADALIAKGVTARAAHALVGAAVAQAESDGRALDARDLAHLAAEAGIASLQAPLDARSSIGAKQTCGSTSPDDVRAQVEAVSTELASLARQLA